MLTLILIAVVALSLGVLFLMSKKTLEKLSDLMNKVIVKNKPITENYSKILGVMLIIFACTLFYIASKIR
ncbi:MAG: hypothetical protein MUC39_02945 [Candidatus Omnitrophica bacterium]|jgi:hypothetical protein|nr:hypothetical protein [Candidatus Omnitrophota bacterium]